MPDGMGSTLTERLGPLPTWAWAGIATAGLGGYLLYRKKQSTTAANAAAASANGVSSNLGTVPISNLTTEAEPMPIQMGDTFVNVPQSATATATSTSTSTSPTTCPPGQTLTTVGGVTKCIANTGILPTQTPTPTPAPSSPIVTPKPPVKPLPAATPPPKPATPAAKQQTQAVCAWPSWCGSLYGIAQKFYGNGNLWPTIYNANKAVIGANPNLIKVGQNLIIPPKPS